MKKILSLLLVGVMMFSALPVAYAADVDYQNGTEVEYTGTRSTVEDDGSVTHNAEYTITVPALLAPGGSGTVTLEGYWPSDATVKVTAEEKVEVVNNINSADKKELAVTFASIEKAGSNTAIVTASAPVSVADITDAIFGTWSGTFNYNVAMSDVAGGTETPTPDPEQPSNPDDGDDGSEGEMVRYAFEPEDYDAKMGTTTATDAVVLIPEKFTYDGVNYQVTSIGNKAFMYNQNLTSIEIPDSVTCIEAHAFAGCWYLTSIEIPDSVTSIEENAFAACSSFASIEIPDSVASIGARAFYNSGAITSVKFLGNSKLTSIEEAMFMECRKLTSIEIPSSVTSIGDAAFYNCKSLQTITFNGTIEQWNAITFGSTDWNRNVPATKVICSDGTVSLS